jgi:hypothetical protein
MTDKTKQLVDSIIAENPFDGTYDKTPTPISPLTLKEQETQAILEISLGVQRYLAALDIALDALNHTNDEMKRELAIQMIEELLGKEHG